MLAQDTHAPKTVHGAQWGKKASSINLEELGSMCFFLFWNLRNNKTQGQTYTASKTATCENWQLSVSVFWCLDVFNGCKHRTVFFVLQIVFVIVFIVVKTCEHCFGSHRNPTQRHNVTDSCCFPVFFGGFCWHKNGLDTGNLWEFQRHVPVAEFSSCNGQPGPRWMNFYVAIGLALNVMAFALVQARRCGCCNVETQENLSQFVWTTLGPILLLLGSHRPKTGGIRTGNSSGDVPTWIPICDKRSNWNIFFWRRSEDAMIYYPAHIHIGNMVCICDVIATGRQENPWNGGSKAIGASQNQSTHIKTMGQR